MAWSSADLSFVLLHDITDDPVVMVEIMTPVGRLFAMAEVRAVGRTLFLDGLHMHGAEAGANAIGPANLRVLAETILERMDYDELVVAGAVRTTGAGPRRRPGVLRFVSRPGIVQGR